MQWLASISVRRPVFATVITLSLTVVGAFAFTRLGLDRFPKVDFPTVVVTTRFPGAAPEEVETEVTDQIEEAVNTISGIDELRSNSSEGVSQVIIAFLLEKDGDVAAQEVRDRVNRVLPLLPRTIEQPTVEKFDPDAAPVMTLAVSASAPIRDITEYADKKLRRQLESVSGVGQVVVVGGRPRQINFLLDADRLRAYNLTVTDVSRAIQTQNAEIPGGRVEQGATAMTLRTRGRVGAVEKFGEIVVRQREGHQVLLRDVATIEDGMAEPETTANLNGEPGVMLTVRRQSGTNTVQVVDAVKERLAEVAPLAPAGYSIRVVRDLSEFIKASIASVEEHLVLGSILAAAVVLVFLWNWRSTFIAAVAIPTSIIATFGLIWYQGFTLNSMTMLALTLAVGIVIDDAIVVLENIYRFVEEKGRPPMQAAVEATREIGLAVLATTLSLVAIFVPVGFMGGIVGRFMTSFGFTMSFAILVSLVVSFTLTPMLASRWIKMKPRREDAEGHAIDEKTSRDKGFFGALDRGYTSILGWSLAHRGIVAGIAVLVLLSSVPLFMVANKNFLPNDDQAEFEVGLRAPEGTSLEATEIIANRIASRIQQMPGVSYTLVTIADDPARTQNLGTIYVRLTPVHERDRDQFELMNVVRTEVLPAVGVPNLRTGVRAVATIGGGGNQNAEIQFTISGPDLKKLEQYAGAVIAEAKKEPGVVDLDTSLNVGKPELSVNLDRLKAADLGVQISDAAEALRLLVGGDQITTYNEGGEQYEVHVRAAEGNRQTPEAIGQLTVPSSTVGSVPLDNIAELTRGTAPSEINRLNRQRQVTVFAGLLQGVSQVPAMDAMTRAADGLGMGPGYRTEVRRPIARAWPRGAELPHRVRPVARVHVPDPRGPVRVVAPPHHDPAVAAADVAVRAAVDHHHRSVAEHLLGARAAGAVRGRQEELDSADRSREPASRARDGSRRRGPAGQPGPAAADPDDDARVRGGYDPAGAVERRRVRDEPRHRLRHYRRAIARASSHSRCNTSRVLAVRRSVEDQAPAVETRCGAGRRDARRAVALAVDRVGPGDSGHAAAPVRATQPQPVPRRPWSGSRATRRSGSRSKTIPISPSAGSIRRLAIRRSRPRRARSCRRCRPGSSGTVRTRRRRTCSRATTAPRPTSGRRTSGSTSSFRGEARPTRPASTGRARRRTAS